MGGDDEPKPVGLTSTGRRVGETHHRATISDAVVKRIHDLHDYEAMSWRDIAGLLGLKLDTVKAIGRFKRRAENPVNWKTPRAE